MITPETRYKTRDGEFHATPDKATSHCLTKAHLELTELLKDAGIEGAYRYAQKIIERLRASKGDAMDEVAAWLADGVGDISDDDDNWRPR